MHPLPAEHHDQLDRLPEFYWWHRHRIELAAGLLNRYLSASSESPVHYLDVGGGTGATTCAIASILTEKLKLPLFAENTVCVEGDPSLKVQQSSKPIDFRYCDLDNDWDVGAGRFHFFTLLDVLEHVHDPVRLLKNIKTQMQPGGVGVITVPAYNFLFSDWDIKVGHKKRYTIQELSKEAEKAGFTVEWASYLFSYALPPAVLTRYFGLAKSRTTEFPTIPLWMNALLCRLGRVERAISAKMPVPFGTSVAMLVRT